MLYPIELLVHHLLLGMIWVAPITVNLPATIRLEIQDGTSNPLSRRRSARRLSCGRPRRAEVAMLRRYAAGGSHDSPVRGSTLGRCLNRMRPRVSPAGGK